MTRRERRIGARMNLDFLARKREGLVAKANEILARARTDERPLTADELAAHKDALTQIEQVDATLRAHDAQTAVEVAAAQPTQAARSGQPGAPERATAIVDPREALRSDEYREAFDRWVRTGDMSELRAHTVGTDTAGGHLVPDDWFNSIVTKIRERNVMRSPAIGATILTTSSGILHIPIENGAGTAAWTAEGATYNESEDTFSEVLLDAYKATRIVKVSEELLADSMFSIEQWLAMSFANAFAELEEAAFVNGDGSGKPRGVLRDAATGTTASATNAITFDELTTLFYALKTPYREKGSWLMKGSTVEALAKIKTGVASDLRYLWRESLAEGTPPKLFGRPIVISDNMPAIATGNKAVAFGDFSYFYIAQRGSMPILRLNERFRDSGLIGFLGNLRVDSELTQTEAVKVLALA